MKFIVQLRQPSLGFRVFFLFFFPVCFIPIVFCVLKYVKMHVMKGKKGYCTLIFLIKSRSCEK